MEQQVIEKIICNLSKLNLHFLKAVLAYTSKLAEQGGEVMKVNINKRYRELIIALLPKIKDEKSLHELYVHAIAVAEKRENGCLTLKG